MGGKSGFYQGKHYTEYVETIKGMKKNGQLIELETLLLALLDAVETEARANDLGVAPWCYEQLAITYRKKKDIGAEIAILERFAAQKHAPGVTPPRLLGRLEKAKCRRDGKPYMSQPGKGSTTSPVKSEVHTPEGTYNTLLDESREEQPSFTYGIGGCIDVETTGLSPNNDEVIELALVLFFYNRKTGEITEVLDGYTGLREPDCSISRGASKVHGLTKRKLRGKELDNKRILALLKQADFLISHNARFDYSFVTPLFPEAAAKPWYCSMNGISWRRKGFSSKGLQSLLGDHSIEVAQSHRALDDARAVVTLLGRCNNKGKPYLSELLKSSPIVDRAFREVAATTEKRAKE